MESYAHETGMAKQRMDSKRRLELFHRINRIVVDDAASMPLYQQFDLYGVNKRLVSKARGDTTSNASVGSGLSSQDEL